MSSIAKQTKVDPDLDQSVSSSSAEYTNSTATGNQQLSPEEERDEVKEVLAESRQDTNRVRFWRLVVAGAIVVTALAVTLSTYAHLHKEEENKFRTAFEQLSMTVSIAAIEQQKNLRLAYTGLADMITTAANVSNATWPFFTFPRFEQFAHSALYQSKTEDVNIVHLVKDKDRDAWLQYASEHYQDWMEEGYRIESHREGPQVYDNFKKEGYHPYVTRADGVGGFEKEDDKHYHFVSWSYSPPPLTYGVINWDYTTIPAYHEIIKAVAHLKNESLFTAVTKYGSEGATFTEEEHAAKHSATLAGVQEKLPHSFFFHPVHEVPDDNESEMVAVVVSRHAWDSSLIGILPQNTHGINVVLQNSCNQTVTFLLDGEDAFYVGVGDRHDRRYSDMEVVVDLALHSHPELASVKGHCMYSMHIYPTAAFEQEWDDDTSKVFAVIIASTFVLIVATFFIYDMFVQQRNDKLVERAAKTSAIVSSLFPAAFRDKLMDKNEQAKNVSKNLQSFQSSAEENGSLTTKPLADLFLETTILFADIVGFTAWSSVREPAQVFTLLETIYSNFDKIAKNRRIFKVETVGDCFVAAAGIPQPRQDHAVAMCRFAREMLHSMRILVKDLEVTLGLGTAELDLRVGIHSGPVTGGILRGEKARFQLFGDTMNTASRMESNGTPGRIHLSEATAKILIELGKGKWIQKRDCQVNVKGKGHIQTYWLVSSYDQRSSMTSSHSSEECSTNMSESVEVALDKSGTTPEEEKTMRLVNWHVDILLSFLKQMAAKRNAQATLDSVYKGRIERLEREALHGAGDVLEEVVDIIHLPDYDSRISMTRMGLSDEEIGSTVVDQLRAYVTCIANMYRSNPFHNFEHASHVTMSVAKLLSRIVSPMDAFDAADDNNVGDASLLHDHTYGITSDPLTMFACTFSALIHDVDHPGVPNAQLVKEQTPVAAVFKDRSVAEQNSFTIAWDLLMDQRFADLRQMIYKTDAEFRRFRQLVVNSMMATDIADKQLKTARNNRWNIAFAKQSVNNIQQHEVRDMVNRKATIVIEHLIQASDVSHTMQHWHIYRKWNERFFLECYKAYQEGRADKDPSETWYEGELGFFDYYIIPLAKKLKDCGVFGKSSDEYLSYATQNRSEWEVRGKQVLVEMIENMRDTGDWSSTEA